MIEPAVDLYTSIGGGWVRGQLRLTCCKLRAVPLVLRLLILGQIQNAPGESMGRGRQSWGRAECCAAETELRVYEHQLHPVPTPPNIVQGSQMHLWLEVEWWLIGPFLYSLQGQFALETSVLFTKVALLVA